MMGGPTDPGAGLQLAIARRQLGDVERRSDALRSLLRAVELDASQADAWKLIADHMMALGDPAGADAAYANHLAVADSGVGLRQPAIALCAGRLPEAESLLRQHLLKSPDDVAALRMLAEVAMRLRRFGPAEELLRHALAVAPGHEACRHNLARALHELDRNAEALEEIDRLLVDEPGNAACQNLKANILARTGDHAGAAAVFGRVLDEFPGNPRIWVAYGDSLKAAGRAEESIAAYRRAGSLAPGFGEAWWSLANLKTFRYSRDDIDLMQRALAVPGSGSDDRMHFHFALGKAHEDEGRYSDSFQHYAAGNGIRRAALRYRADATSAYVGRTSALFNSDFLRQRGDWGCASSGPIFIVGLPRSGSTLVEQILASHSAVEGTMELPDVIAIARSLADPSTTRQPPYYPEVLATLTRDQVDALGERYIRQTHARRGSGLPRFVDKMPNNWMHVGFIHMMLPNARIIDVRRHPMSCCFSAFKQHFARGQVYTYDLDDIGRYYADYTCLMSHFDAVLPGRIHRVLYEELVEDTETVIRRLLDHCGLPFEERCLEFYDSDRAVSTASSEQVRRPIYRDSLEQWKHYEQWLGPLRHALGPALLHYPPRT